MSDQRPDDETLGRALGRAVESQSVRETPYAASRLAHRIDRPARGGWLGTLAAAAAIALFVGMGAFIVTRGPQGGVANPDTSASPTASPDPTARATLPPPSGTTTSVVALRAYFARDGLPPIGAELRVAMPSDADAVQRITGRLTGLVDARQSDVPAGASTAVGLTAAQRAQVQPVFTSSISGDLATVDVTTAQRWPISGSAMEKAFLQQLVYTATEEPGIRRVLFTGSGGKPLTIDQLTVDKPLSREDVFVYAPMAPSDQRIESNGTVVAADVTSRIDYVQTGSSWQTVRLVIDLAPRQTVPGGSWMPAFTATMRPTAGASVAKYEIEVSVPRGTATSLRDQTIDVTPLRYVRVGANSEGTTYRLGVDDARPWRVSIQPGTGGGMRLHVDIGGHPTMVNRNIAVYEPSGDQPLSSSITIAGAARVYEANVSWRLRDANGREVARGFTTATNGTGPVWGSFQTTATVPTGLSGRATLEVYWGSPRDGTDQDVVSIPLQVR